MGEHSPGPPPPTGPFGAAGDVDGIVFAADVDSPELRMSPDMLAAPPPRPGPTRPAPGPARRPAPTGPWQPGPPPHRPRRGPARAWRITRVVLLGLVPILLGVGLLAFAVRLYAGR